MEESFDEPIAVVLLDTGMAALAITSLALVGWDGCYDASCRFHDALLPDSVPGPARLVSCYKA